MALLLLTSGSISAQRGFRSMLINKTDGTTDTVYIDKPAGRLAPFSMKSYGQSSKLDYFDIKISLNPYSGLLSVVSNYSKSGKYAGCSNAQYYGIIISNSEIDIKKLGSVLDFTNCMILCNGNDTTVHTPGYVRTGLYDYVSYSNQVRYSGYPNGEVELPYDGKDIYVYAYAKDFGSDVLPIVFSKLQIVHKSMKECADINGYSNFGVVRNGDSYDGFAFHLDFEDIKSRYAEDFSGMSDTEIHVLFDKSLTYILYDTKGLKAQAVRSMEGYEGTLYLVDKLPTGMETSIINTLRDAKVPNTLVNALPKVAGVSDFAVSLSEHNNYIANSVNPLKFERVNDLWNNIDGEKTILAPVCSAWNEVQTKASPYYNYLSSYACLDLEKVGTTPAANILSYISSYSTTINVPKTETNGMATKNLAQPLILTDSQLADVKDFENHCTATTSCTDGTIKTIDSYFLAPWKSYNPSLSYETPCRVLNMKAVGPTRYEVPLSELSGRDSLFANVPEFIMKRIMPDGKDTFSFLATDKANLTARSATPELDYSLKNLRSTKYHIFVVTVPGQLREPEMEVHTDGLYPAFFMAYTNASGRANCYRLNVPGALKSTDPIKLRPDVVNVVELEFDNPVCYAGLSDIAPTLMIAHDTSKVKFSISTNRKKFDQELRIAGIFAITDEEYQTLVK